MLRPALNSGSSASAGSVDFANHNTSRRELSVAAPVQQLDRAQLQFPDLGEFNSNTSQKLGDTISEAKTPLDFPDTSLTSETKESRGPFQSAVTVGSSLLIVVGLFLGLVWVFRKVNPSTASGSLPKDSLQILGRTSLAAKHQLVVVQFGPKLVLLSLQQNEVRTLAEIQDPTEVAEFHRHSGTAGIETIANGSVPHEYTVQEQSQQIDTQQFLQGRELEQAKLIAGSLSRTTSNEQEATEVSQAFRNVFAQGAAT